MCALVHLRTFFPIRFHVIAGCKGLFWVKVVVMSLLLHGVYTVAHGLLAFMSHLHVPCTLEFPALLACTWANGPLKNVLSGIHIVDATGVNFM